MKRKERNNSKKFISLLAWLGSAKEGKDWNIFVPFLSVPKIPFFYQKLNKYFRYLYFDKNVRAWIGRSEIIHLLHEEINSNWKTVAEFFEWWFYFLFLFFYRLKRVFYAWVWCWYSLYLIAFIVHFGWCSTDNSMMTLILLKNGSMKSLFLFIEGKVCA